MFNPEKEAWLAAQDDRRVWPEDFDEADRADIAREERHRRQNADCEREDEPEADE